MSEQVTTDLPIEKIREYCAGQPISKLSVFRSAVRDEMTPESDIDLLVDYSPGARVGYFELAQQEIDLSELIGRKVDLRTPNELSRLFRRDVVESARPIYAKA
ncbi:MAG: nucleotidyltransferase domain-containing protein [Chloroflexi bacterium]|nr:nucleotidyltransferase domain-containing protein [Chloroflexota bacterium]